MAHVFQKDVWVLCPKDAIEDPSRWHLHTGREEVIKTMEAWHGDDRSYVGFKINAILDGQTTWHPADTIMARRRDKEHRESKNAQQAD